MIQNKKVKRIFELLHKYQIPGFRTRYMWKSNLAFIGYGLIILFSLIMWGVYSFWYGLLWFVILTGLVFIFANYKDILNLIPNFSKKKNTRIFTYIGLAIVSMIVIGITFAQAPIEHKGVNEEPEVKGTATQEPVIETKTETTEEIINFETKEEKDNTLAKDQAKVKQEGKDGKKKITYDVFYTDGKETSRRKTGEEIIEKPIDKIILIGIKEITETTAQPAPTQVEQTDNQNSSPVSSETIGQKNAVKKAKSYLDYSAFSHDGLVAQLEYEQFSHDDAVYGANNSGADWNEQAAKKAQQYMEYSAFSRGSLIEQLKYEKFTQEQAEYGANAVGL